MDRKGTTMADKQRANLRSERLGCRVPKHLPSPELVLTL
jgi:hypothetical protein